MCAFYVMLLLAIVLICPSNYGFWLALWYLQIFYIYNYCLYMTTKVYAFDPVPWWWILVIHVLHLVSHKDIKLIVCLWLIGNKPQIVIFIPILKIYYQLFLFLACSYTTINIHWPCFCTVVSFYDISMILNYVIASNKEWQHYYEIHTGTLSLFFFAKLSWTASQKYSTLTQYLSQSTPEMVKQLPDNTSPALLLS